MLPALWALLLPFVPGNGLKVDVTKDTPGTQWSPGWSSVAGERYFGGTLISAKDAGTTLVYNFTGTAISVYGTEGTNSRSKRANSSYIIDGSTPHVHQERVTTPTSNVLFYNSTTLEDTYHMLVIKNLVDGDELQLDYFEVIGNAVHWGGGQTLASVPPSGVDKRLQPAVIGGLAVASAVVFAGFILLFVVWRRHHIRERTRKTEIHPESQLQSQDNAQRVPFLNEPARIEPFTSVSPQPSQALTPAVMTITPLRPPPVEPATATSTRCHDEKRPLPIGPGHTMESISRLNLGLDVNSRNHSVVGQSSDYESEASQAPHRRNREGDGGVSLLGSPETVNPKALRLPPDYRRFYPQRS